MKITTKLMLMLAFVGSLVLTSCKDYDEDNYNNALVSNATVAQKLADDIATLRQKLGDLKSCDCDKELVQSISDRVDSLLIGRDGDTSSVSLLVKVDNLIDRIDYLTGFNGEKKTLENVISDIIAKVQSDSNTLAKADTLFREQIAILNDTLKNYATVQQLNNAVDSINTKVLKPRIDSLWLAVDSLANVTDSLHNQVDSLKDARQKLITGVLIQDVYSNAIGSFNASALGVNTNVLIAYYGEATNAVTFPSFPNTEGEVSADASFSDYRSFKAGDLLYREDGKVGTIYLTINPVDENFDKLAEGSLQLVNSQDVESGVKLGVASKSDKTLKLGYTRAADNGFYEVPAVIEKSTIEEVKSGARKDLSLGFDAKAVASSLKNLTTASNNTEIRAGVVNVAGNIYSALSHVDLDALGVKTSWNDSLGNHSVNSEYKIAACAVKPLGFYSADGVFSKTSLPMYDKAANMIVKIADKAADIVLEKYNAEYVNEQIAMLADRRIKDVRHIDGTTIVELTLEYRLHQGDPFITKTLQIDMTDPNNADIAGAVASADLAALFVNMNRLVNEANEYYTKYVVNRGYRDIIRDYLDELNTKAVDLYNSTYHFFRPVLIVKSDNGYARCGYAGAATKVKGNVSLYATTFTDGLLTPVYMKYVEIDGVGKIYTAEDEADNAINLGSLSKGTHKIKYSALDYQGKECGYEYEIIVE